MKLISPQDALSLLGHPEYATIDVRSEGEFAQGHLPGFVNLPILRNSERHEVGLAYKKKGQDEAIRLGHALVSADREQRIQGWLDQGRGRTAIVTCWRGGLRSKIATEWMAEAGANVRRVEGGYKGMRAELLPLYANPGPLIVLSGYTGAGKTELIRALPGHWSLDLEGMAKHRGSAFGKLYDDPQPAQATFENLLGLQLYRERHEHLVEGESLRIGTVGLPVEFKNKMNESPVIILDESVEKRSDRIFDEYVALPLRRGITRERVLETLKASTMGLKRGLGGALAADICAMLDRLFQNPANDTDPLAHREWIAPLLTQYYDKCYRYSLEKTEPKIVFQGTQEECKEWIGKKFASLKR